MLGYGIPVSIGTILTGLLTVFYSYILAFYVTDNALIGNYNLAINFSILITFFATPVTTMLFPAFSKLDYRKDHDTLKNVFQYSVKYASLIVVPVAALVICACATRRRIHIPQQLCFGSIVFGVAFSYLSLHCFGKSKRK